VPEPFASVFHPLKSKPVRENPDSLGTEIAEPFAAIPGAFAPVPELALNARYE
jgi:hypothetical protein